jgi:CPA2 family monovalent cation:H+ antiporter-2
MHADPLLLTLAAGFTLAVLLGLLAHRIGLSPILGYLVAGIVVGPHTPGFVADASLASQLAEVGVVLLMFGVGLHFHIGDLLAVRRIAVPGALIQSAVATALGVRPRARRARPPRGVRRRATGRGPRGCGTRRRGAPRDHAARA